MKKLNSFVSAVRKVLAVIFPFDQHDGYGVHNGDSEIANLLNSLMKSCFARQFSAFPHLPEPLIRCTVARNT